MAAVDLQELASAISADNPGGPNPEYDPDFIEMAQAAEGRPERAMGSAVVAAEPPDWRTVAQLARQILKRALDLRAAVYLTRAELNLNGYAGLATGLHLIRSLLEQHWEAVHPQLDPADGFDPTFRINTLLTLCDRRTLARDILAARLTNAKGIGEVTLRDVQVLRGELEPPADAKRPPLDAGLIQAAFTQSPLAELAATQTAIQCASTEVKAIDGLLMERVGSTQSLTFDPLLQLLRSAEAALAQYLPTAAAEAAGDADQGHGTTASATAAATPVGPVRSREHAVELMDQISAYFRQHEPSSPVPLFMARAKRLTGLDFMEILQDLAPDGLKQARVFSAEENESR